MKWNRFDRVQKRKGYFFPGVVLSSTEKLDGKVLVLVECVSRECKGMCHIFADEDLMERKGYVDGELG